MIHERSMAPNCIEVGRVLTEVLRSSNAGQQVNVASCEGGENQGRPSQKSEGEE